MIHYNQNLRNNNVWIFQNIGERSWSQGETEKTKTGVESVDNKLINPRFEFIANADLDIWQIVITQFA